jgi:hypothetical protein
MSKKRTFDEQIVDRHTASPLEVIKWAIEGNLAEAKRVKRVSNELVTVLDKVCVTKLAYGKSFASLLADDNAAKAFNAYFTFFARRSFSYWLQSLCKAVYNPPGLDFDKGHICLKECKHAHEFHRWLFRAFKRTKSLEAALKKLVANMPRKDNCSNDDVLKECCETIETELQKDEFMDSLGDTELLP